MCTLKSDEVISDMLTSDICFAILIFMFYVLLTNEPGISYAYLVAAIRKIRTKQRFYVLGFNGVQHVQ